MRHSDSLQKRHVRLTATAPAHIDLQMSRVQQQECVRPNAAHAVTDIYVLIAVACYCQIFTPPFPKQKARPSASPC